MDEGTQKKTKKKDQDNDTDKNAEKFCFRCFNKGKQKQMQQEYISHGNEKFTLQWNKQTAY